MDQHSDATAITGFRMTLATKETGPVPGNRQLPSGSKKTWLSSRLGGNPPTGVDCSFG